MTSSKLTLIVASLVLGAFIGIGSVGKVHADTNAWATPFPDYCHGNTGCLNTGTNPWLGGADTGGDRATTGVRVKIIVSSDTNPANIPSDNSLGAGIAAAVLCAGSSDCGAGCPDPLHFNCPVNSEDYIFYGFVDLSHSGRVRFISSGWHDCEFDNCAPVVSNLPQDCLTGENGWNTCPDSYHWQLFHDSWTCTDCTVAGSNFLVEMMWVGGTAVWNYYRSTSTCSLCLAHSFSYTPSSSFHMESNYKTGSGQTTSFPVWYHYQFGVTALNNIGAGWNIEMDNPEYYSTDCNSVVSWCLVRNAAVYDGYNSYFDDNYDLGGRVFSGGTPVNEPNFNGVTVSSLQVDSRCYTAVGFTYTGNTPAQPNGQSLWTNAGPGCSFPGDPTLSSSSAAVPADGTSSATLTAQLANNAPSVQMSFSTTLGTLSSSTCTTGSSGSCSVTIKSSSVGTATISATCAGCPSAQTTVSFAANFSVVASPSSLTLQAGTSGTSTITLTSGGGFSGSVSLSATISAGGPTPLLNPTTVTLTAGSTATSTMTVSPAITASPGSYTATVAGTSGSLSNSITISVTVTPPVSYMFPATFAQNGGVSGSQVIALVNNPVSVSVKVSSVGTTSGTLSADVRQDIVLYPDTTLTTLSVPVTVNTGTNVVQLGSFTPSIVTSGCIGCVREYFIRVYWNGFVIYNPQDPSTRENVQTVSSDFALSSSPSTLALQAGTSGSFTITLNSRGGFAGNVTLSGTVSPNVLNGAGISINPTTISLGSGGTGSSAVTANAGTVAGTYTIQVTGVSGSLTRLVVMTLNVVDFGVSASPTAISLSQSHSATSTITLSSLNGFSGNVALSANAPAGFTATLNPTTVSLTSGGTATSTLTITATGTQISGTYTVTVTGSSGTLSHQTAVSVSYTVGGNLLSNPGFETGSFASWSQTGMIIRGDAGSMHSGLYGAAPAYNPSTQIYSAFTLQQNLPSAVAGSSITKIQLWYRWGTSADSVQVLYTDGTYTQTNLPFVGSWTLVNAAFDSTKTISGIKVVRTSGQYTNLNLDDFILG